MQYENNNRRVRKIAKNFVMSVRLSVHPHGKTQLPLDGFSWRFKVEHYLKISRENSSLIKTWQEKRIVYMNTIIHVWSYLDQFFLEWKLFQRSVVEKIKIHVLYSLYIYIYIYTGCLGGNVPDFGRIFLKLKYTDITKNTYIWSWTVTEIKAREKRGLLDVPRTVSGSRDVLLVHCACPSLSTAGSSAFTLRLHM